MQRRRFLAGTALLSMMGCSSPRPFDEARIRAEFPPVGEFTDGLGLRIHYWEAGQGAPVVLIHGASGNLRDWTFDVAPMLARDYRVIVFDRPGFGYSERPTVDGWDPAVQARILKAAADTLDVRDPVVVGHSWGGAVAMAWALEFPRAVGGVVPVSAVTMPYGGLATVINAIGLDGVLVQAYMDRLLERAHEGGIDEFIARVFRPQQVPEGYVHHVGALLALRESTLRANGEDLQNLNIALRRMAPTYNRVTVPVEILHGQADFISWDRHAAPLAAVVPQARLNLLPGVGHMAHHAAPLELRRAIGRIVAA